MRVEKRKVPKGISIALSWWRKLHAKHYLLFTLVGAGVIATMGAYIFYLRYPFALDSPNFYAEDGKDFLVNLIEKGPIAGSLTVFNGYLIVGQYLVGVAAEFINALLFQGKFVHLPESIAIASYGFFGVVCMLPWLLFRRKLGSLVAFLTVVVLWITPLGGYDYAVIGTIGNLKFAFLFIATLLILYRNDESLCRKIWQFILIDIVLLLCVLTNIVTLGLIPLILIRYRHDLYDIWKRKKGALKALLYNPAFISATILALLSAVYVLLVYINGVPKLPGYLDGPLDKSAMLALVYRASTYGILFPLSLYMNNFYALISILLALIVALRSKYRWTLLLIGYVMALNVIGFVYNRPGVSGYFAAYDAGVWPGHFFYAGTMLFVFGLALLGSYRFNRMKILTQAVSALVIVSLAFMVFPAAGYTKKDVYGETTPSIRAQLVDKCRNRGVEPDKELTLTIYPTPAWTMSLARHHVCN